MLEKIIAHSYLNFDLVRRIDFSAVTEVRSILVEFSDESWIIFYENSVDQKIAAIFSELLRRFFPDEVK